MAKMAMGFGLLVLVSVLPATTGLFLMALHQTVSIVGLQIGQSLGCLGSGTSAAW